MLLAADVPVLLVPKGYQSHGLARSITVGWDGSRESSRAAHYALPLLGGADNVAVVAVDNDGIADDLTKHLGRRGITRHLLKHSPVPILMSQLIVLPIGKVRIGGKDAKPDDSYPGWIAMLFAAGSGIGLLFFGVLEPVY